MKKQANLHNGHWERIRNRILQLPTSNLSDIDVLEGLLQLVFRRADTNEIARNLLNKFNNINNLSKATKNEIANTSGMGINSAEKLKMVFNCIEFIKMEQSSITYNTPNTTATAYDLVKDNFRGLDKEMLMAHYLDNNQYVIHNDIIIRSADIDKVGIDYNKICEQAQNYNAKKVIISHNHPTNNILPSLQDFQCTSRLYGMLRKLDIRLIDHLIIGDNTYFSFFSSKILSYIAELYDQSILSSIYNIKNLNILKK